MIRPASCVAAGVLFIAACQGPGMYHWGGYEGSVQRVAPESEQFDLEAEIDNLETDLEQAQNRDRLVPPGFHVHLGYLLYMRGDREAAVRQFEAEKARFPESAQFVDGLIARITRSGAPNP